MITHHVTLKVQGTELHSFFRILQENYGVAENFGPCRGNMFRSIECLVQVTTVWVTEFIAEPCNSVLKNI